MRKLSSEKRALILTALVEGMGINATCRLFRTSKTTVLRLLADAGTLAAEYHDQCAWDLECERIQADEIWSFVHSKNKNVQRKDIGKGFGDAWVWASMCADSKFVISWTVGGRDSMFARPFVQDTASRVRGRVQFSTDGWRPYIDAVSRAFGNDVDYGQIIKKYAHQNGQGPERRYSQPDCVGIDKKSVMGCPMTQHISTSYIERQNLTMRMQMRRFTRLTNAHSKTLANHIHAVNLHYFHYNWIRKHSTIKTTPAVAVGLTCQEWTMLDFVKMLEREEKKRGGRLASDYLPATPKAK